MRFLSLEIYSFITGRANSIPLFFCTSYLFVNTILNNIHYFDFPMKWKLLPIHLPANLSSGKYWCFFHTKFLTRNIRGITATSDTYQDNCILVSSYLRQNVRVVMAHRTKIQRCGKIGEPHPGEDGYSMKMKEIKSHD